MEKDALNLQHVVGGRVINVETLFIELIEKYGDPYQWGMLG